MQLLVVRLSIYLVITHTLNLIHFCWSCYSIAEKLISYALAASPDYAEPLPPKNCGILVLIGKCFLVPSMTWVVESETGCAHCLVEQFFASVDKDTFIAKINQLLIYLIVQTFIDPMILG